MKTTTAFFLFTLLAAAAHAAEDRLIPFDELFIDVGINGASQKLRVAVKVQRTAHEPLGSAAIEVSCPDFTSQNKTLEITEVADFLAACKAAANGEAYRKEVRTGFDKTVYEVVKVSDGTRVSALRGRQVMFDPEEGARLKETLAQAVVTAEWYRLLLREHSLPAKTAEAHPPKAASFYLSSRVGGVQCEGMGYEVLLTHLGRPTDLQYFVMHGLRHASLHGGMSISRGEWVKSLLAQVSLALQAAEKNTAFRFESAPSSAQGSKFTVTANLMTQRADVTFVPGRIFGKSSPEECSFGVAELTAIRELAEQGEARAKWFTEHEEWLLEGE